MVQDKETININLTVPTSWEKLSEKQLRYVFGLIALGFAIQQGTKVFFGRGGEIEKWSFVWLLGKLRLILH